MKFSSYVVAVVKAAIAIWPSVAHHTSASVIAAGRTLQDEDVQVLCEEANATLSDLLCASAQDIDSFSRHCRTACRVCTHCESCFDAHGTKCCHMAEGFVDQLSTDCTDATTPELQSPVCKVIKETCGINRKLRVHKPQDNHGEDAPDLGILSHRRAHTFDESVRNLESDSPTSSDDPYYLPEICEDGKQCYISSYAYCGNFCCEGDTYYYWGYRTIPTCPTGTFLYQYWGYTYCTNQGSFACASNPSSTSSD